VSQLIHVAVAVIVNDRQEVLLSLRARDVHQGGLWEFPGGKIEEGETAFNALVRELEEELGITTRQALPLIKIRHAYSDRTVLLDVWQVSEYSGEAHGRENQTIKWVPVDQLDASIMPAADIPIIHAVQLPDQYLITPQPDKNLKQFLQQLEVSLAAGIRLVQLRAPALTDVDYRQVALKAQVLTQRYHARLMINHSFEMFNQLNADGLHLTASRMLALDKRPVSDKHWLSASCHNLQELEKAQQLGVDFVMLSPVLPTLSHPGADTLGWTQFKTLAEQASIPVYALGGMTTEMTEEARQQGAQGIAGIRSLWSTVSRSGYAEK